jgi:hypothetical protein
MMDSNKNHHVVPPKAGLNSGLPPDGMKPLEFDTRCGKVPPGRDFPFGEKAVFDFFQGCYH